MPSLRVIASFYNCEAEVAPGLETVRAQTMGDFECIVVDDCSKDRTPQLIEEWIDRTGDPRFRFAPNMENKGIAWVRSHHSSDADVQYLAFQEAGDLSRPDRYRKSVEKIESDRRIGMVGCGFRNVVVETGRSYLKTGLNEDGLTFEKLLRGNRFSGGELFYSYDALKAVGGIVSDLPHAEDYYLTLRIARRYRIGYLPEVLYERALSFKGLSFRPDSFVTQCQCVLAVRDLAQAQPVSDAEYLRERGGVEAYRQDKRLRALLARGAVRSAVYGDWRASRAIALMALMP